ncbi:MAG: hypothetical protein JSR60_16315 [Proteobacteria bacterium]|nr:hypothetical protein [Pseudomonadota bacterium]
MRLLIGAMALLTAFCAAAPAQANAFDLLQKLCIATHADRTAVVAAAVQLGWKPVDPAMLPKDGTLATYATREASGRLYFVTISAGGLVNGDSDGATTCAIITMPAEPDAVAQAHTWAGVDPEKCSDFDCYVIEGAEGHHVKLDRTAMRTPEFRNDPTAMMFMVGLSSEGTTLSVVMPTRPSTSGQLEPATPHRFADATRKAVKG